jgi:hypothetical protein
MGDGAVGSPAEFCEPLRAKLITRAQNLGCATGQIRTCNDASCYLLSFKFNFVCFGTRDDVVGTMGELSKKFMTEVP